MTAIEKVSDKELSNRLNALTKAFVDIIRDKAQSLGKNEEEITNYEISIATNILGNIVMSYRGDLESTKKNASNVIDGVILWFEAVIADKEAKEGKLNG